MNERWRLLACSRLPLKPSVNTFHRLSLVALWLFAQIDAVLPLWNPAVVLASKRKTNAQVGRKIRYLSWSSENKTATSFFVLGFRRKTTPHFRSEHGPAKGPQASNQQTTTHHPEIQSSLKRVRLEDLSYRKHSGRNSTRHDRSNDGIPQASGSKTRQDKAEWKKVKPRVSDLRAQGLTCAKTDNAIGGQIKSLRLLDSIGIYFLNAPVVRCDDVNHSGS